MRNKKDEIWESNGGDIAVADMTEEHAKNALRIAIRIIKENGFKFGIGGGFE